MIKKWAISLVNLLHSIKDENLHWQTVNQEQLTNLKQARILHEQELAASLLKKSTQLTHELALLKAQQDTELLMFKTRCDQDIKDYKQYLKALDQLKLSIQTSYSHLPEAIAFTIHHHAKQLLNKMWEANDFEQKMQLELHLIQFMAAVHDDAKHYLEAGGEKKLPEKTLELLKPH